MISRRRPARRFVLWGGGRHDVQIGSGLDRRIQLQRKVLADLEQLGRELTDRIAPILDKAVRQMNEFALALKKVQDAAAVDEKEIIGRLLVATTKSAPGPTGGTAPGRPGS